MFTLSSISKGLEFWYTNHTSIYKNSQWKFLKNIKLLGEISNDWPNSLLETHVWKALLLVLSNF